TEPERQPPPPLANARQSAALGKPGRLERPRHRIRPATPIQPRALDFHLTYCHSEHMTVLKEERLQIRVDPARKRMLERAASATQQTVSAFVLQAASLQAETVLAERSVISLPPDAAQAFQEALAEPGRVNERLAAALQTPR